MKRGWPHSLLANHLPEAGAIRKVEPGARKVDGRCFASASRRPELRQPGIQLLQSRLIGRPEGGRKVGDWYRSCCESGGCDAGANLKEGNHVKFVRAGNGDNECTGLTHRRVAGFSPMSAPQTGLCRRSGERSSNTASERRAHSGRFGLARVVLESFSTVARMPRTRMGLFQTPLTGLRRRAGVGQESVWSRRCDTEGVVKPLVCNGGANTKGVNA
jgi:hypothetical protein